MTEPADLPAVVRRDLVYSHPLLSLRVDLLRDAAGGEYTRRVLQYRPAAAVVAIAEDGCVLLVPHYRYPVGKVLWELPGGMIDGDESPLDAAARELQEETGYTSLSLAPLLTYYPEPAFAQHTVHLLTALELRRMAGARAYETELGNPAFVTRSQVESMMEDGRIASSWTIIGLLRAFRQEPAREGACGGH